MGNDSKPHWLEEAALISAKRLRDTDPRYLDKVGKRLREEAIWYLIKHYEDSP